MTDKLILKRQILKKLVDGELSNSEASKILSLSIRQIQRLKFKYKKSHSLEHGLKGRLSNNSTLQASGEVAIEFIKEKYYDFGPKFASEQLAKNENITLSPETVRNLMIREKLWQPRSYKALKVHIRRKRKDSFGEMIQFDGSYHRWFEERADKCCLLVAIDDATGRVMQLVFCEDEGVVNVMKFWWKYILKHGKPLNVYLDRFSTYTMHIKSAKELGELTEFERAMESDLGINLINAHSPQAKGRVERLNQTLQDRLIKELRLQGISTMIDANMFVEKVFIHEFNERFQVQALSSTNLHTPLAKEIKVRLRHIFSIQSIRVVSNDLVVSFQNKQYQISKGFRIFPKDRLVVEKHLKGKICMRRRDRYVDFKVFKPALKVVTNKAKKERVYTSLPDSHPWKRFRLPGSNPRV